MVANLFVKFGADTTEFQKQMRASVTRMLFVAESFTQAGRIMTATITAPMLAIGAASLKTAMQFESAMTRMVSLVGMPAETIARWKPVVQDMAGIVGKSANELAEALFFITSNGIRTDEALKVLTATAKASAVGMGETKDIAIAATSALNAYGTGALTANESVAVLIGTVREGNLEAAELPAALSKLLPIAAAMGIEFHEAGAGIAAMSRSGTSARLAAFGLRAIMMGILAPTKSAAAAMESVDLSAAKLKQVLAGPQGLRDALLLMKDATEKSDVTLKDLIPNQRAFAAALQLLGKNTQDYIDISNNMAEVIGEDVNDSFELGADTMERTYKQAMGKLSSAAIDLGDNMAPLIDNFADLATKVSETARAYNELGETQKGLIDGAAIFLVAIGPLTYAIGSLSRMAARFMGLSIMFKAPWIKAAAGFATASSSASILTTKLGALKWGFGTVGAVLGTFLATYNLAKWLDDAVGTTEALNEEFGRFGDAATTVGEVFEKGGERMENATDASHRLAMSMGEVNLANELMDARMEGNGKKMAELTKKIEEKANAYNKARIKVEGLTQEEEKFAEGQQAIKDAQAEIDAEETDRLKKLREAHGLMTSDEVTDKMAEMTGHYKDHINDGVEQGLINAQFKDDWEKLVELGRVYGIAVTDSFKAIGRSMVETGDLESNEFYKMFDYYIPQAIDAIPGKVIEGMVKIETGVADKLKGGLNRGFAEGLDEYTTTIKPQFEKALDATWKGGFTNFGDAMRDEINLSVAAINAGPPLQVAVVPDPEIFNNAMNDLLDGNMPDTRG